MAFRPLTKEEAQKHYPEGLRLESVQIFFRHGARTPTSPLFMEAGLPVYWPLCSSDRHMLASIYTNGNDGPHPVSLPWERVIEKVRSDDGPERAKENSNLCNHGELTDRGRMSMVQLGQDLRKQYITNLSLLPSVLSNPSTVFFRSSPFPRALESLQHVVWGMFPPEARAPGFGPVKIVQRGERDETLLPNEDFCARFIDLCKEYTKRSSEKWDKSDEMAYVNRLIGKHVPSQPIRIAGVPKIHAIYDGITSTLATDESSGIRLPGGFYDRRLGDIVDALAYEEEFGGYRENRELRAVGIGAMLGDVVERMVAQAELSQVNKSRESNTTQLWLHGSHDSTLGAVMASLDADKAIEGERRWPPYGSVLAMELFRDVRITGDAAKDVRQWSSLSSSHLSDAHILRTPTSQLSQAQKLRLQNYYVRLRYNNRALAIPGCKVREGNWKGDETFCTLEAFKEIVDSFTPQNWRQACVQNLDKGILN